MNEKIDNRFKVNYFNIDNTPHGIAMLTIQI